MTTVAYAVVVCALLASASVHATTAGDGAKHGNHAYGAYAGAAARAQAALSAATAAQATKTGMSGNGGSMVDSYQPWPESEMGQFQKK